MASCYAMKPNNTEMFNSLRAFHLPTTDYLIIGSGSLGIRNLKTINDIDIIVTPTLWDTLSHQFGITIDGELEKITFPGGIIEVFHQRSFNNLLQVPSTSDRIAKAEIIEGLPFDSLENTLFFKRKMGREKDLNDIRLIEIVCTTFFPDLLY